MRRTLFPVIPAVLVATLALSTAGCAQRTPTPTEAPQTHAAACAEVHEAMLALKQVDLAPLFGDPAGAQGAIDQLGAAVSPLKGSVTQKRVRAKVAKVAAAIRAYSEYNEALSDNYEYSEAGTRNAKLRAYTAAADTLAAECATE
jgi:hypothetical protein